LLEVLVAFAIASLMLVTFVPIFSSGVGAVRSADKASAAAVLAEAKMAEVGASIPLAPGTHAGAARADWRWQVTIQPYQDAAGAVPTQPPVDMLLVAATVTWPERRQQRTFELTTLRLAVKAQ
jgi:general secretion pathway protein I